MAVFWMARCRCVPMVGRSPLMRTPSGPTSNVLIIEVSLSGGWDHVSSHKKLHEYLKSFSYLAALQRY